MAAASIAPEPGLPSGLRLALINRRRMGPAGRVHDFSTPCEGGGATPRGPEDHGEHDPQSASSHQDPADRMDVDRPVRCDVNGEGEYGANRQKKYPNSKTHAACLLVPPNGI